MRGREPDPLSLANMKPIAISALFCGHARTPRFKNAANLWLVACRESRFL